MQQVAVVVAIRKSSLPLLQRPTPMPWEQRAQQGQQEGADLLVGREQRG